MRLPILSLLLFCVVILLSISCNSGQDTKSSTDTAVFFPLREFIQGEVQEVLRTPYLIVQYQIQSNQVDSAVIDTAAFKYAAAQFMPKDFNHQDWKPAFNEAVFNDQTTKTYTLSYTSSKATIPLKQADITAADNSNKVKRIFVRYQFVSDDTTIFQSGIWKPGKSFWLSTTKKIADSVISTKNIYIKWNDNSPLPLIPNER